jgi:integrase
VARELAEARLEALTEQVELVPRRTPATDRALGNVIRHHLRMKAASREGTEQWLGNVEVHLTADANYFGDDQDITLVQPADVEEYAVWLSRQSNGRGGELSSGSIVQYLSSLSNLYRRAISMGLVGMGQNPVANMHSKPKVVRVKTPWLEIPEMTAILQYAFDAYVPDRKELALPFFPQALATMALSGGRDAEVTGLRRVDVNLDRGIILIRPNEWRRLKNTNSKRPVRIFLQLAEVLRTHLSGPDAPQGDLLFPAYVDGHEQMVTDLRKAFDKMPMPSRLRRRPTPAEFDREVERRQAKLERVKTRRRGPKFKESIEELQEAVGDWVIPPLRTRILRHTYTAARLQTLDRGQPISMYTVARELGHTDTRMIRSIYGHLGQFRSRGEEVCFRW